MQFQVPQFIEVEDKIFGPFTFKQFVYLGGGLGAGYLIWRLLPFYLAIPIVSVVVGFAAALAFFNYNGRPFIVAVENAFFFFTRTHLYLWDSTRAAKNTAAQTAVVPAQGVAYVPKLSDSKLHDLAWSLDIRERIAGGITEQDRDVTAPIITARDALAQ